MNYTPPTIGLKLLDDIEKTIILYMRDSLHKPREVIEHRELIECGLANNTAAEQVCSKFKGLGLLSEYIPTAFHIETEATYEYANAIENQLPRLPESAIDLGGGNIAFGGSPAIRRYRYLREKIRRDRVRRSHENDIATKTDGPAKSVVTTASSSGKSSRSMADDNNGPRPLMLLLWMLIAFIIGGLMQILELLFA